MQPGPPKKLPPRSLASWVRVAILFHVRVATAAGRHIRDRLLMVPPPHQALPSQHRLSHIAASSPSPEMASSSPSSSSPHASSSQASSCPAPSDPPPPSSTLSDTATSNSHHWQQQRTAQRQPGTSSSSNRPSSPPATQSGDSDLQSPSQTAQSPLQQWLPLRPSEPRLTRGLQDEDRLLEEATHPSQSRAASPNPAETHPLQDLSSLSDSPGSRQPSAEETTGHQTPTVHHPLGHAQAQELGGMSLSQEEAQSQFPAQSQFLAQSQDQAGVGSSCGRGRAVEEAQEGLGEGRYADGMPKGESEGDSLIGQGPGARFCRICFEGEESRQLIAPCQCKGTQKYVHRSCLDSWRAAKEGFAFAHCTECRAPFALRVRVPPDRYWRKLQFRACVAVDHVVLFISVQIVVAAVASITFLCLGDQLSSQLGYQDQADSFFLLAVVLSVAVGILYGFFLAIIFSEHIERRHAYILQRQALTQEYFVEDLEENASPTRKLLPEHEQELVSLGLM